MSKKKRRLAVSAISLSALIVLAVIAFNSLLPIVNARAIQYSRSRATEIINIAVKNVMDSAPGYYSELLSYRTDNDGNILSVSANTVKINKLKSEVSAEIIKLISSKETGSLKIPIGNLSGMYLFTGRGFGISVKLIPASSVLTEVESSFSEAGINQSWHRMAMKVTLDIGVIVLGKHLSVKVCDRVVITDTVIVGKVPDAYTDIEKLDDDTLGDIVDFKAG